MRSYACRCYGARGGVFVSTPAYADGYVDGTGNNIYYGYKTDASYSEARFHIEVDYYDTLEHAKAGKEGKDKLGKFVRVHYLSNCNQTDGGKADDWRFRPMWWFGVPAGLKEPQDIHFKRTEKLTSEGNKKITPTGSSQQVTTDANGYGVVSDRSYATAKEWNGISNFYLTGDKVLASKGWKQLLGLDDKGSKGYDKVGNTESQWKDYQKETAGLQGIFVDWESAGTRYYDMTYVAEMTQDAWEKRDEHPLRFAAGVYRFAGNWHYAAGQKHNTPKIADHLTLKYPDVTLVKDPSKLSEDEKKAVKKAIEDANKDTKYYSKLVDKVEVSDKGVATITFKDKTTRTIPASILVAKGESDSDKYKPIMPDRTPVVKPSKLTDEDKKTVIAAFKEKNKDNTDFNKHLKAGDDAIKFNDDGTKLVITYKDDSKLEIPASELVYQGATIADWAPYVVPDTITVDNLKQLTDDDVTKIKNAFDTANQGITPYDESKAKNGNNAPVEVNKTTGDVTITWKDGSTTTIDAWQFLKEKKKATPEQQTPTEEKTFTVDVPRTQTQVSFDPFKMTQDDLTKNEKTLNGAKSMFTGEKGKDAKDPTKKVNITSAEYSVSDGVGYITFKADGYKDAKYPMSVFFKQKPSEVLPQDGSPSSTTTRQGTRYNYRKFKIKGDTPTDAEKNAAVKQFVSDNYDGTVNDCSNGTYYLNQGLKPKNTTSGLSITASDGIQYVQAKDSQIIVVNKNGKTVITISDPYEKNQAQGGAQADNTIDNLKKQAKALLAKRVKTDRLTNEDLKRAGIEKPGELNDAKIDSMAKGQTAEKDLRDLIRKLTDAKKAAYKWITPNPVEVDDINKPTKDNFLKAVRAFLNANYGPVTATALGGIFNTEDSLTNTMRPVDGTVNMETYEFGTRPNGLWYYACAKNGSSDDYTTIVFKDHDKNELFRVKANYKKKGGEDKPPVPSAEDLKKFKEQAKQQIDRNPNLTDDQKKQYKQDIEGAKTVDKIKEILKNAADKGKENQNDPSKAQTITDNKGGGNAKKGAEEKQKEKEDKKQEDQKKQELEDKKKKASEEIDKLDNLTSDEKQKLKDQINGNGTTENLTGVATPEEVQKILDDAKNLNEAHKLVKVGELPFLDHGTGKDEDKALNDILGSKSAKDSVLTTLEEKIKAGSTATAKEIKTALDAAKRQNEINEANAKNAGIAKLEAKKAELDAAYNALNDEQKAKVNDKYNAAITAITNAESAVNKATKPSQIKNAMNIDATIKDAKDAINTQVSNAQKDNVKDPSQTQNGQLDKEKKEQIERINKSDLPEAEKQKAIKDINAATKLGDPTAIANRYLKAKKIEDALKKIDEFKHLNKAQKDAFKAIINGTDAGNHTNDDGTTTDDIDDALANATATDTAMARLEELKKKANEFKDKADGKYSKLTNSDDDQNKKKAFDGYLKDATKLTTADQGDAKNADQVNELYKDLLNAMQAIDNTAKGAGVSTDALQAEVDKDSKLKPTPADPNDSTKPATPGDSLYTTASKEKKEAFDQALSDAEAALKTANDDNANQAKPDSTPRTPEQEAQAQQAVDTALKNLQKAREELDGVNTKPLEQQIAKDADIKANVKYTNADTDKKQEYDDALAAAKKLITDLTTPSAAGASTPQYGDITLNTKENKQKALDAALKKLQDAAEALNGRAPEPTPTPTPADVDKTALASEIALDSTIGRRMSYTVSPSDKQLAYDRALSKARAVYADPSATQDDVNAALEALRAAARALSGYGSVDNDVNPLPTPVPGGHEDSGFGVNDNAPTTVDKGELNVQIDSAEADSQPGNGNAANANTNAGNAANNNAANANTNAANTNNANGANSAAVNAAVENSPAVKQADAQVSKAQAALDAALSEAKKVAADPNATQAQVDAAAQKLSAARKALASAKAHAAEVRASVRAQVLKSGVSQLSKTGSNVSVFGLFAAVAAAGAAFFVAKRRGISRHSNN